MLELHTDTPDAVPAALDALHSAIQIDAIQIGAGQIGVHPASGGPLVLDVLR